MVVLHYTAMRDAEAAIRWLCDPASEVSAHYLIDEAGVVVAMVPEDRRAWHAGAGSWGGCDDVNSRSIGIELANDAASPFPHAQMTALETLLRDVTRRHAIPARHVIAHSDCAPGRKVDPGARFDWRRLARAGLAVHVTGGTASVEVAARAAGPATGASGPAAGAAEARGEPSGGSARRPGGALARGGGDETSSIGRFAADCVVAGYTVGTPADTLLAAFRLRHRPWAAGALSPADMALAAALARDYPVDPASPRA